ncbi:vascular endothelial growth factor receptor 1-like [Amphiura filiformis]|uniref:vascular endothelial growth factor receptor 1-like n=1 Tax=Amphiura filiformis TaxID=82378 RepID=UPI003B21BECA
MFTTSNSQDGLCCRQKGQGIQDPCHCGTCWWKCGLQLGTAFHFVLLMFGLMINVNQAATPSPPLLISVDEGKSVTLPCLTELSEYYQIRWYAPGDRQQPVLQDKPLRGSWYDQNRGTIHSNTSLEIYSASHDDSGVYVCDADYLYNDVRMTIEINLDVHDASPKIDPLERTSLIENETLTLTCQGGFYLAWHYPESTESRVRIAITTHITGTSRQSWKQTNVLTIDHVVYTDTGEYLCAHHHPSDEGQQHVGDALSDSVYIYVTGPKDTTSLFIPTSTTTVTAYADDNSILIPCRVTNPAAKVTLITEPTPGIILEISHILRTTQYDPQRGFVVQEQLQSFGTELRCRAQVEKIVDEQVFIFNYIGKPEIAVQNPPNEAVNSTTSELIIAESDYMLELVCTGQVPLIWYYPDEAYFKLSVESTAELNPIPNTGLLYRSVLRVTNITTRETGEYACIMVRYIGQELEDDLRRAIYVYITSTDAGNLFLPVTRDETVVKVYPDRPFTVPCRISDPKYATEVRFVSLTGDFTSFYDLSNNRTFNYDPKIGFTFGVHAEGKIIPNLQFICSAVVADAATIDFVLLYVGDNKGALFPIIYPSNEVTIKGQTQVNITCEVSIEKRLLNRLTSDFYPQFEILYPAQQHPEFIEESNYYREKDEKLEDEHKLFCETLHIQNISMYDMGTYICEVYNAAGKANTSTDITVLDRGYVKVDNTNVSTIEVTKDVNNFCQIQFQVEAFPDVNYEWFKDDLNIAMDEMSIEQHVNGSSVFLCISQVDEMHAGNYTLVASNQYQREAVNIQLIVLVEPAITITTTPEPYTALLPHLFRIGKEYTLNCSATGNPVPSVWWEWYECTTDNGNRCEPPSNPDEWTQVSTQEPGSSENAGVELRQPASNIALQVIRKAKLAGFYRCVAESPKFDNIVKYQDFLVTELDEGFGIDKTYVEKYETENVELSCKASYYSFRFVRWKRKDPVTNATVGFLHNPAVEINDVETDLYSILITLSIASANISDSGKYKCVAKPFAGVRIIKDMILRVKALVSPVIIEGLQNQTKIDRSRGAYTLSCMASADPIPEITWQRDGMPPIKGQVISTSQPNVYKSTYVITSLNEDHDGRYSCTATNLGGSAKSISDILILESPRVQASEELVRAKIGMNATLSCKIMGLPEPTITWEHTTSDNKERVVPKMVYRNDGRMLYFKEVTEADAGVYRCIATNELGKSTDQIVLNIDVPPPVLLETFLIPVIIVAAVLFIVMIFLIIILARKWCTQTNKVPVQPPEHNYLEPTLSAVPSYLQDIIDRTPYDLRWEFPRERLQLGSVIGKGAFGMVVRAVAVGIGSSSRSTVVAVKTLREDAGENEYKALMAELKMLIHIGRHLNVVNFLGACTQQSPILVIVEYCRHGNLCHYLRSKRESFMKEHGGGENSYTVEPHNNSGLISPISRVTRSLEDLMSDEREQDYTRISDEEDDNEDDDGITLTINDLICYAFQISRGMEFWPPKDGMSIHQWYSVNWMVNIINDTNLIKGTMLPNLALSIHCQFEILTVQNTQKPDWCIHRDLAARNILVADHNVVKICDFGLSRNLYYDPDYIASSKSLLPIKWMAPESIFDKVFTSQSDVWSFGIVMWETFSLGGSPYPGFQVDERFYDKLKHGYRMSIPDYAAGEIYQIMLECWHREPKQRPTFGELVKILGERLEDRTKEVYMDLEAAHEKDYWEIPDSITCKENNSANGNGITINSPVDLDEPPDHPPIPVPRTIERRPKPVSNVVIETSPHNEPLSPLSPGDSSDGTVLRPRSAVSNGLTHISNLELSRLSFPSNDDLNLTVPMIPNPAIDRSRPSSPTEENALLETLF